MSRANEVYVCRLEQYFKEDELWVKSRGFHRLLWLEDGKGILYVRAGVDFYTPPYKQCGWIVLFNEICIRNFLASYPVHMDTPLLDPTLDQTFIKVNSDLILELKVLANWLESSISSGRHIEYQLPYLNLMLLHAADRYAAENNLPARTWEAGIWRKLNAHMQQHYKTRLATNFYAARLKLDDRKLNEICKAFTGKNVLTKLNDMRFAEAQRLLLLTYDPVKVIGLELGYESASQFSNFFKQLKGISPSEYREMNRLIYPYP